MIQTSLYFLFFYLGRGGGGGHCTVKTDWLFNGIQRLSVIVVADNLRRSGFEGFIFV